MPQPHLAVLGAGPIGLEAALAATDAGLPFTIYEAASAVAGNVAAWSHVRLFTPWDLDVSPRMRRHLGSAAPAGAECPTGAELRAKLLEPVAGLPAIAPHLRRGMTVLAVGREGLLKHEEIASAERARRPFRLLLRDGSGGESIAHADVVLDCTGTYGHPNALGDAGIPAPGELANEDSITRGIPDIAGAPAPWSGQTTLLVGAGHSAQTAARDLAALAATAPGTRVVWALRKPSNCWDTVTDDPLPERARLGAEAGALAAGASPAFDVRRGVAVEALRRQDGKLAVALRNGAGSDEVLVDRVLALTGAVGDHGIYRQLQVHECYATCGPINLSAAILGAGAGGDCLAQASHGADTLKNPEPGFFILGSKSYGRNTTFLLRVGYEQVAEVFGLLGAA